MIDTLAKVSTSYPAQITKPGEEFNTQAPIPAAPQMGKSLTVKNELGLQNQV